MCVIMPEILIFTDKPYNGIVLRYIHELGVRTGQLDSIAQLVYSCGCSRSGLKNVQNLPIVQQSELRNTLYIERGG